MIRRMNEVPDELDWVSRRDECSAAKVFRQLQAGIENDVSAVIRTSPGEFGTTLTHDGRTFVVAEKRVTGPRVVFFISGEKIEIRDEVSGVNRTASLTISNSGRCVMSVDGLELEQWQVRKMALEGLFFGVSDGE